jgi:hypothetical protein
MTEISALKLRVPDSVYQALIDNSERHFTNPLLDELKFDENAPSMDLSEHIRIWKMRFKFLTAWIASHNVQQASKLGINLWESPTKSKDSKLQFKVDFYEGDFSSLFYLLWRLESSSLKDEFTKISTMIQSKDLYSKEKFAKAIFQHSKTPEDSSWIEGFLSQIILPSVEDVKQDGSQPLSLSKVLLDWCLQLGEQDSDLCAPGMLEGRNAYHVMNYLLNDCEDSLNLLVDFAKAMQSDMNLSSEIFYGRAGLLYGFLLIVHEKFAEAEQTPEPISSAMNALVESITNSGYYLAFKRKTPDFNVWYEWNEEPYVGAAHGLAGIVHMLQKANDYVPVNWFDIVVHLIDKLSELQQPDGSFPSTTNTIGHSLCQWCHGSPGVILVFVEFMELTSFNPEMVKLCINAQENVWKCGLLTKGVGLCHGISGNMYSFLHLASYLYKASKIDKKNEQFAMNLLQKSLLFAEFAWQNLHHVWANPDYPFSLMNGLTGFAVSILDLLNLLEDVSSSTVTNRKFRGLPFFADYGSFDTIF